MDHGGGEEQDGEDYGSGHGWVIAVVLEAYRVGLVAHGGVRHGDAVHVWIKIERVALTDGTSVEKCRKVTVFFYSNEMSREILVTRDLVTKRILSA